VVDEDRDAAKLAAERRLLKRIGGRFDYALKDAKI